jgi:hypothetical protein
MWEPARAYSRPLRSRRSASSAPWREHTAALVKSEVTPCETRGQDALSRAHSARGSLAARRTHAQLDRARLRSPWRIARGRQGFTPSAQSASPPRAVASSTQRLQRRPWRFVNPHSTNCSAFIAAQHIERLERSLERGQGFIDRRYVLFARLARGRVGRGRRCDFCDRRVGRRTGATSSLARTPRRGITPHASERWGFVCSTTQRSLRRTRERAASTASPSSTGTSITETERKTSSTATPPCSSPRSTSGRSIPERGARTRSATTTDAGRFSTFLCPRTRTASRTPRRSSESCCRCSRTSRRSSS